jgi:steroid delta-isomerase-like uncharacterized protein
MADDLKALVKKFNDEVLSKGNLDMIDEVVADDFVEHQAGPGMPSGKDGLRAFTETFRAAFPDLKVDTKDLVAEGDEVWAYSTMSGTHTGEFMGIPPTGKKFEVSGFDRVRFKDGKAVEHWGVFEDMSMMQQLGVIPEM